MIFLAELAFKSDRLLGERCIKMKEVFTYLLLFNFLLNGFCLNAKETFTVTG